MTDKREYQKADDGASRDDGKPAEIGIGEKSTDDRSEIGGGRPEEDDCGSSGGLHSVNPSQIEYHTGRQTLTGDLLKCYIR